VLPLSTPLILHRSVAMLRVFVCLHKAFTLKMHACLLPLIKMVVVIAFSFSFPYVIFAVVRLQSRAVYFYASSSLLNIG